MGLAGTLGGGGRWGCREGEESCRAGHLPLNLFWGLGGAGGGGQLLLESWVFPPWGSLPLQLGRDAGRAAGPSPHLPHSLPGVLSRQLGVHGVGWVDPVILSRAEALEFRGLTRPLPVSGEAS